MASPVAIDEIQLKYDVFISFSGGDTCDRFTRHLHAALVRRNIHAFIDDTFPRGQDIGPTLSKAIKESEVAVIIFSQSYGGSSWCLDELVEILEYRDQRGMVVLPVFYFVDPSDVEEQKEKFGDKFKKLKKQYMDEGNKWSDALRIAANIGGLVSKDFRPDSRLVEEVVKCVFMRLKRLVSRLSADLVGMELRIKEMLNLLQTEKKNVLSLGIWGMGGVGKTTCAKALVDQIAEDFESCYFQADVREESRKHPSGFLHLKILSEILYMENPPYFLSQLDRRMLSQKKVLIILDDVSETEQLETIAGKHDLYGPGSRIIVTSRDKQVLEKGDCVLYEVGCLSDVDALRLFSLHAFKSNIPDASYLKLSKKVVRYAGGVPLALEVLGSFLYKKPLAVWKSKSQRLRSKLDPKILNVLKISYEELDEDQQNIFLDIACFFIGEDKDIVTDVLQGCGFSAGIGIGRLIDKCLITVADDKKLQMHELIEEMGKYIVREESEDCEKRSRLWEPKEIIPMLKENKGSKSTQSILLDGYQFHESFSFSSMSKLRLLKITQDYLYRFSPYYSPPYLPSNLSYLHVDHYPWKSLNEDLSPAKLVHLDLRHSMMKQLWSGAKVLPQLKRIDLSHSKKLILLPNLSSAVNLEVIILDCCEALCEIPTSIGHLKRVVHLSLYKCLKISSLPSLVDLKSLQILNLSFCKSLKECPSIGCYNSLRKLDLSHTCIKQLPESLGYFSSLVELNLEYTEIEELPISIGLLTDLVQLNLTYCERLSSLPSNICELKSLQKLEMFGCQLLRELPNLEGLNSLTVLDLRDTGILELPESLGSLSALENLFLNATQISTLPSSICELKSLKTLKMRGCQHLCKLPPLEGLHSLTVLDLSNTGILELPESLGSLSALQDLLLEKNQINSLPCSICELQSLKTLYMRGCQYLCELPHLEGLYSLTVLDLADTGILELPESLGSLSALQNLLLERTQIITLPSSIRKLKSLLTLVMCGCQHLCKLPHLEGLHSLTILDLSDSGILVLPESLGSLSALQNLFLEKTQINTLPCSIRELESLKTLYMRGCQHLRKLPPLEGLDSLTVLDLTDTGILELPESLGSLSALQKLFLQGTDIKEIPSSIRQLDNLETKYILPKGVLKPAEQIRDVSPSKSLSVNLRAECIKELQLCYTTFSYQLEYALEFCLKDLVNLEQIELSNCNFAGMPNLSGASKLHTLDLHGCKNLVDVSYVKYLTKLEYLILKGCTSLMSLPSLEELKLLISIDVSGCKRLRGLPSLGCLSRLSTLDLRNCKRIQDLPESISKLTSLEVLSISGCLKLVERMIR